MKGLRGRLISKREWEQQRQAEEAARAALKEKSAAAWKAQQDWNAKPSAERVEDARYVLHWTPWNAESVMKGTISILEALESAREFEQVCIRCAEKSRHTSVEVVWALIQLTWRMPDADRAALLAPATPDEVVRDPQEWWAGRLRKAGISL